MRSDKDAASLSVMTVATSPFPSRRLRPASYAYLPAENIIAELSAEPRVKPVAISSESMLPARHRSSACASISTLRFFIFISIMQAAHSPSLSSMSAQLLPFTLMPQVCISPWPLTSLCFSSHFSSCSMTSAVVDALVGALNPVDVVDSQRARTSRRLGPLQLLPNPIAGMGRTWTTSSNVTRLSRQL